MKLVEPVIFGDAKVFVKSSETMSEIEDNSVNLIITSPPYWTLKDYGTEDQIGLGSNSYESYIENLNKVWSECVRVLAPDGKICINIMPFLLTGKAAKFDRRETKLVLPDIANFMETTGEMYQFAMYIWDKRKIARFSSFGSYPYPTNIFSTYPYEWITVFSKKGKRPKVPQEIKDQSKLTTKEWQDWAINSIWEMQPAKAKSEGHPAPFPDELPKRLIKLHSFYGDTVLDPFLGTGTTAKMALQLGRKAIGYELNKEYLPLIERKLNLLL
ncbi:MULTISPECIES: site-specific DNA-methyltransferase [unclassified Marinobacterium]|uniref:DNA-methyltransferase n=1 Tax=unclassified Marinobacterium TaxID=2644139 RepID=UPI0015682AE4|nr:MULTISPECIES: site-specific DNA-methyltransferase [unclassified Marinobacterium]NRP52361.1 DNA adenine methyltransferase YhdJ [Marinobacterium sp. xm-v-242]NRP76942.1 DNA adenine methyltransferase YhdJ [Marinobacterium sp. xm-m-383]